MKTYHEKYALVADSILEARQASPDGRLIKFCIDRNSKLADLFVKEIQNVLENLQLEHALDEYVFSRPSNLRDVEDIHDEPLAKIYPGAEIKFELKLAEGFDNWQVAYLKRKNRKLNDLDGANFEKIYDLLIEIHSRLQIKYHYQVTVNPYCNLSAEKYPVMTEACDINSNDSSRFRADAIEYLEDEGVITNCEPRLTYDNDWGNECNERIELKLHLKKFEKFYEVAAHEHKTRNKKKVVVPKLEVPTESERVDKAERPVYQIKYTGGREIVLNGFLLSQLNFDSENHVVFEYVFQKPNQQITLDEIQKASCNVIITKSLTKIVENWGFTGDLKKAFFDVSKGKIKFRNPIYEKDLKALDITRLRFPRS